MSKVSFTKNDSFGNQFSKELKRRVGEYFSSSNISPKGNILLFSKTVILFFLLGLFFYLLVFTHFSLWLKAPMCIILGVIIASIGFNVMHDGAHGSYSEIEWVNEMTGLSLNFLGGNLFFWKRKHNVNHHTFTNIDGDGHDEDFNIPFVRTDEKQKRRRFHKYQHIYAVVLYCFIYLLWVYLTDFVKYFSGKINKVTIRDKMNLKEHIIFWVSKLVHVGIFVVIPLMHIPFMHWLIGFLLLNFSCGITLSIVFQLAHVMPNTSFPLPDIYSGKIERNWMLHQLATTTDFATQSKVISWLVGGLNFQVEHHLFYKISHVHYPAIRLIVKKLCEETGVPHLEYPTFAQAFRAHFSYLKKLGREG